MRSCLLLVYVRSHKSAILGFFPFSLMCFAVLSEKLFGTDRVVFFFFFFFFFLFFLIPFLFHSFGCALVCWFLLSSTHPHAHTHTHTVFCYTSIASFILPSLLTHARRRLLPLVFTFSFFSFTSLLLSTT
mmetsp:Transcript_13836/g.41683  ORF Transcript_13836/g.41683 Transcript_13836/m.41683 type:complete len:130 (-) Transcript_13836:22-411(-)